MTTRLIGLAHHLPAVAEVAGVRRPIASDPVGPSDLAAVAAERPWKRPGSLRRMWISSSSRR